MKQKIRIWLRNFFGFSRTETNGFIILNLLMVVVLALPFISKAILSFINPSLQSKQDKKELYMLLEELEGNLTSKKDALKVDSYKSFDLNKSNVPELISSGFPAFLAERIVKYREKVKSFESKTDLLKIYGIDSTFYTSIYPFITVSSISKKPEKNVKKREEDKIAVKEQTFSESKNKREILESIDINKADSFQLQKIYGIGPAYSSRIIKYREYLGGFHSVSQLEEVYGLKTENLDSLKKYVFISSDLNLRKLKVNTLNVDSLVQHPYISYKEANLIVNFRNQHGDFTSTKALLEIKILDSSWVQKVKPYFTFD